MKRRLFVVLTVLVSVACSAPAATPTTAPVAAPAPTAAPTRASTVTAVPTSAPATATPLSRTTPSATGAEWPQANFDYANTRAAVNGSISSGNVNQLGVAWTFGVSGVSTFGALATSPVVVNGTVYLQDLKSNVYAIDLLTGTLK